MVKYIHSTDTHNTRAAEIVLPILFDILGTPPKSVVDVGCGLGTWLKVCNELGIEKIHGFEGHHLDVSKLVIAPENISLHDLEKPIEVDKKFDLVISLEVAEHLDFNSSDIFVKSLTELGDVVLFSAAIKGQGGQNHINEQDPNFWRLKFKEYEYDCFDVIRGKIWDNPKVDYWYSQNVFLYAKKGKLPFEPSTEAHLYIHPILFEQVLTQRNRLSKMSGYFIWEKIKKLFRKI